MRFSILTLFPQLVAPYFQASILKRALDKQIFSLEITNMRDFSPHKHQRADFAPIGGGAGQILDPYMLENALRGVGQGHVIFLSPSGRPYNQSDAKRLATYAHLILVCGRYEGFDERVIEAYGDEVLGIGDFILTGGELAALCVCDSVARHLEGTLGNSQSLEHESFEGHLLEAPHFANTDRLNTPSCVDMPAISEYSKGNHAKIRSVMRDLSICKTQYYRPSLYRLNRSQRMVFDSLYQKG
ncbi:tRNA (guanosine(37)-N1)-methyltransferase TrmD [Helicobacter bizzozeronii]|uniref:tRNA (guanosine(37)-N1)-methyltransferase TrmD n=1 Tax=Helicobacter bizzozeronii TaxID=56877 RepID=UPI000CED7FD4|nr:tRNA (guanosine(37)-N1)-methyltransferase TrmD [Helicobacter bizzozeronii]